VDNRSGSKQPSTSTTPVPQPATEPKAPFPPTGPSATTVPPTAPKAAPTQPKSNKVLPAVPMTVNQKSFTPPVPTAAEVVANGTKPTAKPVPTQAAMDEAKEAVAAALAKLPQASAQPKAATTTASIDALSKKISEMGPVSNGTQRGRGGFRGRGPYPRTGSGGHQARKIEIPKSDYDFESANAKFNKEDLIKEAIASGSPVAEPAEENANGTNPEIEGLKRKDSIPLGNEKAYNKSTSFFDNISSEAKDREDHQEARHSGRQLRGEEMKRNVETFGQANIDGGFRGRGRGRGRAYGGTYRGAYNRGYSSGGFRGRGRGGQTSAAPPTEAPVAQS
jgi:protein LSM14